MSQQTIPALNCGYATLSDGNKMPYFGLGCYLANPGDDAYGGVLSALSQGYRLIDTAELYNNESDVGRAIIDSGIPRNEIFIVTKFWSLNGHGKEKVFNSCESSLKKLQVDYIDLYLIHSPAEVENRDESWKAMEELKTLGKVKSIGVSNYGVHHLEHLLKICTSPPVVNQIELSPFLTRNELVSYCEKNGIVVQAYSPLAKGQKLNNPKILEIGKNYKKTPAQILLRWGLQRKFVEIPKSTNPTRVKENSEIFDFEINATDMETLNSLNEDYVTGWDPTKSP
eukprot:c20372_g1_i1.p1 GENE.c20372_g1_i1~~c20372_g1_i1.p1  ORF type:complete len:312 (+),score=113.83 c20372_g1_i1:88-936(+)